jgi:hypothetical protein
MKHKINPAISRIIPMVELIPKKIMKNIMIIQQANAVPNTALNSVFSPFTIAKAILRKIDTIISKIRNKSNTTNQNVIVDKA